MVNSVLVAMDDSPLSREALTFALETFSDAEITVVHVADPEMDMLPAEMNEVYNTSPGELEGVGDAMAQTVFEAVRDVTADRDVSVTFLKGKPDTRLIEYIEEGGFDHAVLGTHGRKGLSRLLIGSVAEEVVRQTNVPTTLIR